MAATPLYGTPAVWRDNLLGGDDDPVVRLLAEIYNQLYNSSSSDMISLYGTTDGTADFQADLLIGKNVTAIWVDGILLNTADYTVDAGTGTVTFTNPPITGLQVLIFYTA